MSKCVWFTIYLTSPHSRSELVLIQHKIKLKKQELAVLLCLLTVFGVLCDELVWHETTVFSMVLITHAARFLNNFRVFPPPLGARSGGGVNQKMHGCI